VKTINAKIMAVAVLFLMVFCSGSSVLAAVSNESLHGTYRFVTTGSSFWKYTGGGGVSVYDIISSDVGTLIFNQDGTCTINWDEKQYEVGLTHNKTFVSEFPDAGSEPCTYSVLPGGEVQLTWAPDDNESLVVSSDGNMLIQGGGWVDNEEGGVDYDAHLTVAVKAGSGLNNSSLVGTFKAVSLDAWYSRHPGFVVKGLYANNVTLTFNGNGGFTGSASGKDLEVNLTYPSSVGVYSGTESFSGTYVVSPTGVVTANFAGESDPETFWLSADGTVLLMGYGGVSPDDDSTDYETGTFIATKVGSGFNNAALNGTFNARYLGRAFEKRGANIINEIDTGPATIIFDGLGKCSVSFVDVDYEVNLSDPNYVYSVTEAGTENCTYTVASNGQTTLTYTDASKDVFWLNANGYVLLAGGATADSIYGDYETTMTVAVLADATSMPPASITVPSGDSDGAYTVSWGASATKGVVYVLEEATDADFSDAAVVYTGTALNKMFVASDHEFGTTYYYRVKAIKLGYENSAWKTGTVGCAVPGTVAGTPASIMVKTEDADGTYAISWMAPATAVPPVVEYVVQEATNSTFTGAQVVYTGPATSLQLAGRQVGTTYYYRVKATGTGFKDSLWRSGANGLKVIGEGVAAVAPSVITVPTGDADGNYTISWYASTTKGVTYVLEEATDSEFTSPVVVHEGTALSKALTGRSLGTTYYYRVKAVHPEYVDSVWRAKTTGCAVPGTILGTPSSIAVPASDSDGNYEVSWGASLSPGVTYVLQESTNSTFTASVQTVYIGNDLTASVFEKVSGVTYYYRVKAVNSGYKDSSWRLATNGCKVLNP